MKDLVNSWVFSKKIIISLFTCMILVSSVFTAVFSGIGITEDLEETNNLFNPINKSPIKSADPPLPLANDTNTSVDTIFPYNVTSSPFTITATGPLDLDNITLYYRWSNDNQSWVSIIDESKNAIDNNISDVDGSSDIGLETNFPNAQDTSPDSDYMIIQEADTGGVSSIAKVGSDTSGTGNSLTLSFSHTLLSGSNRIVIVYVGIENGNTIDVTGVTYGGQDLTKAIDQVAQPSGNYRYISEIWYILDADLPSDGSNQVIITCSGTTSQLEINGYCAEYTGVNQDIPETTDGATATSSPVTNTISPSDDAWCFSTAGSGNTGTVPTQNEGQVQVFDFQDSSSRFSVGELRGANGETSLSTSFSNNINRLCRVVASFTPASITNYTMDFEYIWSDVNYNKDIEEVCFYVSNHTGSENLNVSYWTGSSWNNIGTITGIGWTNLTATGLTSSSYIIRLNDLNDIGDASQDNWDIDVIMLHTWNLTMGIGINWTEWDNISNPDISSPWSWSFDFPNSTGYYEFYSIGKESGLPDESEPSVADAICYFNLSLNSPPVANDDFYNVNEDNTLGVTAPGILLNDTDPEDDPLTAILVSSPSNGTLTTFNENGSFSYTPIANYYGSDSFTYQSYDGIGNPISNIATVWITINPVNDAPVAIDDFYSVNEDTLLDISAPGILLNDLDLENDVLTVQLVSNVSNGILTLNSNGSFEYIPNPDFFGFDSFTYLANDSLADSNIATVNITISSINDPPTANDDTATTNEDTTIWIDILTNDNDIDGTLNPATITITTGPNNGNTNINTTTGEIQYTPNTNYNGPDTFTYTVNDNNGATSNTATVNITITPINDPPTAYDDSYNVNEDTTLNIAAPGILGNDTDPENDPLTTNLITNVTHGTLNLNNNGAFTYTPDTNYNGLDTFTYQAYDGTYYSNTATVNITITPINDPPTANDDSYNVNEDTTLNIAAPGILTNDTDIDGDTLTAIQITSPTNGALTLNSDGSFTYTPNTNYNGIDNFTYVANDSIADSNIATVTITINPINDPPIANDDSYSIDEGGSINIIEPGVLINDIDNESDPLNAILDTAPNYASSFSLNSNGSFVYVHDGSETTTDSFTYHASDSYSNSNIATVTITINPINDAPTAYDDSYNIDEDTNLNIVAPGILGNDTDPENDPLTTNLITNVTHGTLNLNNNGAFTYTPDTNYNGLDTFTYQAYDGTYYSNTATVNITITPINDPPTANDDTATTNEDTTIWIDILTNDNDIDGTLNPATITITTGPNNGNTNINTTTGEIQYTPNTNYNGPDTFTYTVNDNNGATSNTATVNITITPINDPPTANDDSYNVDEDTTLNVAIPGILSNDTDVDGDTLTAIQITSPTNGILTLNSDGSFTYTPNTNYNGTDSFTYQANDSLLNSNIATVIIIVNPINDAPIAYDDSYSVDEGGSLLIIEPGVLTNDIDNESDPLNAILDTAPNYASSFSLNSNGSFVYVHDGSETTTDSFTYHASDSYSNSNIATVTITINPINDAPTAYDDSYNIDEDTNLNIVAPGILGNDTDPENDPLTTNLITNVTHGTLNLNNNGAFTYTPDTNYNGLDTFTYQAYDGTYYSNTATVNITITPINDPPTANDDSYNVNEDTTLNIAAPGILTNDTDIDGDTLTAIQITSPTNGALTLNSDGSFTYTPNTNYNGIDNFTYVANDSIADSNIATVTITINPINDPPTANDDTATTNEDTTIWIDILTNDNDIDGTLNPATITITTGPNNGNTNINTTTGEIQYTPNTNYNGPDTFTYTVNDNNGATSNTATVNITITPINDPPTANDDSYNVDEDTTLNVAIPGILSNDTDVDGDTLTAIQITSPTNGILTLNSDGSFTYTPNTNYNGIDNFTYVANDSIADSNIATVTITINPINDPPIANDDSYSIDEGGSINIIEPGVLINDIDNESDPLNAILDTAPNYATSFSLFSNGSFIYIHDGSETLSDSFTYYANDSISNSNIGTIIIIINPVNDAPIVTDIPNLTIDEGSDFTTIILDNYVDDTDNTDSEMNWSYSGNINLTVTIDTSRIATISTPNSDWYGSETIIFRATDPGNLWDEDNAIFTVNAVNDNPIANDDYYNVNEDTPLTISAPGVLGNDTDIDGDPLTAIQISSPSNGSLTLNSDGSFSYVPDSDFYGMNSFTYVANDSIADSNIATVFITINSVNDNPIANDDSAVVIENTSNNQIDVLANDYDIEGDNLTITSITIPLQGLAATDGVYVYYTSTYGYTNDTFSYTIQDTNGASATAIVNITVVAGNYPPNANDDTVTLPEDTTNNQIDALANDNDPNGDSITIVSISTPTHGTSTTDGNYTYYTPDINYNGADQYNYTITDGQGGTDTATIYITVTPVNDPPTANDDYNTVLEDTINNQIDALVNDNDIDGDTLTIVSTTSPNNGTATTNGQYIFYTPDTNYNGPDQFNYTIIDGNGGTDTATLYITVTPVNDPPTANDDVATVIEDSTDNQINVLINDNDIDGDDLDITSVSNPAHGTTTYTADYIYYTPDTNYNGPDQFSYTITDNNGGTDSATVYITITPVNDPPTANDDTTTVIEDTTNNTINVLTNDNDIDGDTITILSVTTPTHGTATTDGNYTYYTPDTNYAGTDTYTYTITDSSGGTDTAQINITISGVNDPPNAIDDYASVPEDSINNQIDTLANDNDIDGDTLTITNITQPIHGTATYTTTYVYYTPDANYNGPDQLTYTITDGNQGTDTATIYITVGGTNDPPNANDDTTTVTEDSTNNQINVLTNDNDPDGDNLTIVSVSTPTHGTATTDGNYTYYTPNTNYNGPDQYNYTITDGQGGTDTATITITITPINDPPTANDDIATVSEDTSNNQINVLLNDIDIDGDTLIITSLTQPTNGTATYTTTYVYYTPDANYNGPDQLTYTITDGNGGTDTATIYVTVTAVNDPPNAIADTATVIEDSLNNQIDVLTNDNDIDGDTLIILSVTIPNHGTATTDGTNVYYTPNTNYNGADQLNYTISDGNGGTDTANIYITVTPVNDQPSAVADTATVNEDTPDNTIDVIANDNDVDGDTLIITNVTQPTHGSTTYTNDYVFYTPDTNYNGLDQFIYTISDGNGGTDTANVYITVNPINDPPNANDDTATVPEDSSNNQINVLANDNDVDGDSLTITGVTVPLHGTATYTATYVYYTPDTDYNGPDQFSYTISDGNGGTDTATVNIDVGGTNDPPIANDDTTTVAEDSLNNQIDALANDNDPDGDNLTIVSVSIPTHGTATTDSNYTYYTPDTNYNGPDQFSYTISDGLGGTDTATIFVTVTPVNDPPNANDDYNTVIEDSTNNPINVLANDIDIDGDTLSIIDVTQPLHGTITNNVDLIYYTPDSDYTGSDEFNYTASDGKGGTDSATVYITVTPVNDPPTANDDYLSVNEDSNNNQLDVLGNDNDIDGDELDITTISTPAHGIATYTADHVYYTPDANYNGPDQFSYTITDNNGGTDSATIYITVTPVNDPPTANDDTTTVLEDSSNNQIDVLANDNDLDGDNLTITGVTTPLHGTTSYTISYVYYTPDENYTGPDQFSYTISDGNGGADTAVVFITVGGVNDPPNANDDTATVNEDTINYQIDTLANDDDPDGDTLTIIGVTPPLHGTATYTSSFVYYTPDADYTGSDQFTYTISDGNGGTDSATIYITVTPANDPPNANDDTATVNEDTTNNQINVLTNDNDPDGDTLTIIGVTTPNHGTATTDGNYTYYTPNTNYNGPDQYNYTITDGNGGTDTATITITITPINDPPNAIDDYASVLEDSINNQIDALTNDNDIDGDTLTIVSTTNPNNGTATTNGQYIFYTPNNNYNGPDQYSYTIIDGNGGTDNATIYITVTPVNDPPIANDDVATVIEDSTDNQIDALANDNDIDGDDLDITSVSTPAHGTTTYTADYIYYTPDTNYNGPDQFSYTITDNNGGTDSATVYITITPVNDPPTANDDTTTVIEDTTNNTINVLTNDNDIDGDTITILSVTTPTHGTATTDGNYTYYTPDTNYAGTDTYTYTITDSSGGTDTAQINITISGVNDPPNAIDDYASVPEDSINNQIDTLANDNDIDGDTLTITNITQPIHGTATYTTTYVYYTPDANYNGPDQLTYTITDGNQGTDTATIYITVGGTNDPPNANDDTATILEDSNNNQIDVLANDNDPDGDTLTIIGVTTPNHGTATTDGNYTYYTPNTNYNGPDQYNYTITDGNGGTDTATITITITPINDPPTANDDIATVSEDTSNNQINVLLNDIDIDGDTLIITSLTQPTNGTATYTTTYVYYTPDANYNGPDQLTYTITDGNGGTDTATIYVTVTAVNDLPNAVDDYVSVFEDSTNNQIDVLANDNDIDGDDLDIIGVTLPLHGTITFTVDYAYYTPNSNYNGADQFSYTISDGNGGTDTAIVYITITPVNDPPNAIADTATVTEDTTNNQINALANDNDIDGDQLTIISVTIPNHGSASFDDDFAYYTPDPNYNGPDQFIYTISDGQGGTDNATIYITVTSVNDPPTAVNDNATVPEDSSDYQIDVLANDNDIDGDDIDITGVTQPSHGATIYTADFVYYTPDTNYNGPDQFSYTISDGNGGTDAATVYITVGGVNDLPIANDDTATTIEDSTNNQINVLINDNDPDGDDLDIVGVTQPAYGTVTFTADYVYYTPNANYNGPDQFTYTISDNNGGTDTATVYVNVTAVNDPPNANDDYATVIEDSTNFQINSLANDNDIDGDDIDITGVTQPSNGSVTFTADYVYYTPNANYNGPDQFTYTISDNNGGTDTASINITVAAVNDPPNANDDSTNVNEDSSDNQIDVLANDNDIDGDNIDIIGVTQPSHGNTTYTASFVYYTPDNDYTGLDQFSYNITDNNGGNNTAIVYITIGGLNDPPIANDDIATVDEDTSNNQIDVLANDNDIDGDNIDITGVTQPTHGIATFSIDYVYYTPDTDYTGSDQFSYNITDNNGGNATALINITITPQNDPPNIPSNPIPNDGQTGVDINSSLSWTGGDLDGDPVTYDIYFGMTSPPPKIVSNQTDTTYILSTLSYNMKYYWYIVAWDNQGASTTGSIWNFTTVGEYDWDCILTFDEPAGAYDNVYFGEKEAASDGQDIYDVPKGPAGIPPTLRAWFDTGFASPYDKLWEEYKHSPDNYKVWNLTVQWTPSDYISPTNATISWNSSYLNNSEYNNIFLRNNASGEIINMFFEENYTFNASALIPYQFTIICTNEIQITELQTTWNIVSIPFNQSVSKSDLIVEYNNIQYSWQEAVSNNIILGFIYNWNRSAPQQFELTEILKSGYGYWIYAYQNCTLSADGISLINNNGFITNMFLSWNIIGLPNTKSLIKEDFIIRYNGIDYNWTDATTNNNPTGEPIILGYIYNWSRSLPQHYELTDIVNPGYGYYMYAYHNCSLYYPIMGPLGRDYIGLIDNELEDSYLNNQNYKLQNNKIEDIWNVELEFNEPGGIYDNAFFGEKTDASDGQDSYDVPKGPAGVSPLIRAWFDTEMQDPYDELWKDYKQYPDIYKVWNLTVQWIPSDYSSPTTITISWNNEIFYYTDYTSIVLYDVINNIYVADMLVNESYTFTCPALALQNFQIICSSNQNQPPKIPSNPIPNNSETDIDIDINLSWTGGDPDPDDVVTYDIYFGTTSTPPKEKSNLSDTFYNPGKLDNKTIYYWRIIAFDNHGAATSGPLWSFTTKKLKDLNLQETTIKKVAINSNFRPQNLINIIGV